MRQRQAIRDISFRQFQCYQQNMVASKSCCFFFFFSPQRKITHHFNTVTQKPYSNSERTLSKYLPQKSLFHTTVIRGKKQIPNCFKNVWWVPVPPIEDCRLKNISFSGYTTELWPPISAPAMNWCWLHLCTRSYSHRCSDPSYVLSISSLSVPKKGIK